MNFNQEDRRSQNQATNIDQKQQRLTRTIDSMTKSCSKPYFNNILKDLAKQLTKNAEIICD